MLQANSRAHVHFRVGQPLPWCAAQTARQELEAILDMAQLKSTPLETNKIQIFSCSGSALAEAEGTISSKFLTKASLDLATDQEVLDAWQRMKKREGKVTKEEWKKRQQAAGIRFSQQALLLSDALLEQKLLQPWTQYTHDWMHALLSFCF